MKVRKYMMEIIRVSTEEYNKVSTEVIREMMSDKSMPMNLTLLKSMVALEVTIELKKKLFGIDSTSDRVKIF